MKGTKRLHNTQTSCFQLRRLTLLFSEWLWMQVLFSLKVELAKRVHGVAEVHPEADADMLWYRGSQRQRGRGDGAWVSHTLLCLHADQIQGLSPNFVAWAVSKTWMNHYCCDRLKMMGSSINKSDHFSCVSQAWCFTEPTSTVTPLQVSLKRLEPAQSSCRKLTLRNLTFPSESCETDYEMGNKRKTRTAMQSKIAALYRWILQCVVFLDDEEFGGTL